MTQLLSLNSLSNGTCFQESGVELIIKDSGSESGSKVGSIRGNQAGAMYGRLEPGNRRKDPAASEGCPGSLETERLSPPPPKPHWVRMEVWLQSLPLAWLSLILKFSGLIFPIIGPKLRSLVKLCAQISSALLTLNITLCARGLQ